MLTNGITQTRGPQLSNVRYPDILLVYGFVFSKANALTQQGTHVLIDLKY